MLLSTIIRRFFAFGLMACLLAACASDEIVTAPPKDPGERSLAAATTPVAHILARGDQLRVSVFELEAKTTEHTIDETGSIAVPPLAPVVVAKMTTSEAAGALTKAFTEAGLYKNARITVDVIAYGKFYVLGEVENPGEFSYRPGMSLFAAVANAGGHTYRASKRRVFIRRASEAVETEYEITADLAILPGDVIRIPEIHL